ncbi:hypothetical protein L5L55_10260 [Shewanella glacialipiscicola]|uniref:restriction endonuclease-related protein n=1 Tax=Shewanella TaxID=22 RepID=UPI0021D80B9E|nr:MULTISPECIES: hypothetical protein [Shewanella]MCU7995260.1 hypothetical protein [Shewanella glacialipiscicola]MCU8026603.1 hypothetical protein [Shewanella glacialipiscicola]MDH0448810.1 hypothetical protein [Shewanella sp. GD04112]
MIEILTHKAKWSGTAEDLVDTINNVEALSCVSRAREFSKRTINYYRTKGVIDATTSKRYSYRHLVQCLLARKLTNEGWKVQQIADSVPLLSIKQAEFYLEQPVKFEELFKQATTVDKISEDESITATLELTEELLTARMLAKGVLKQYLLVEHGELVDGTQIPIELRQAMCLLGKLRINNGKIDNCASVHEVLSRCIKPFGDDEWGIAEFSSNSFLHRTVSLIDPDHRCPTFDCIELADIRSDADLREKYSFEEFSQLCTSFGAMRHQVYSQIRRFVAENPIVESSVLLDFLKENRIQKADRFLRQACYRSLQEADLINRRLHVCKSCGVPIKMERHGVGRCSIKQCSQFSVDQPLSKNVELTSSLLILKPHLLIYWFGPAIDELKIFYQAESTGLSCSLFPNSDQCDISIDGYDVGIDVKSYQSPHFLAQKLSGSIGGLSEYHHKIIAVNDNLIHHQREYLEILARYYRGNVKLEFMSVAEVVRWLEDM